MIKVTKLTENLNKKQKNLLLRIIAAAVMLVILFILPLDDYPIVRFLLFLIPYFTVGYDILRKAFKGILNHQVFDECFLMAVATIGAMILGEYTEGVAVMLFYQIGELFQSIAVGKSRRSISDLMDIRPDYANLEQDGEVERVDPDEVEVGSIIVIRPGEKVPIDGIVVEGNSSLNTSALTGESLPRDVKPGDEIISGSVNMSGLLRVETTKEFDESTASKILELVENAGERKAKSEQFITKFARWYTPAVCYSALALAILGPVINILAFHKASDWALWSDWIYRALTFLVISCPCAIVVSIPLSFFGGIGGASSEGILIKGSNFMETLANVKYVVMDKTGTITKGNFEVPAVHDGHEQNIDHRSQYRKRKRTIADHRRIPSREFCYELLGFCLALAGVLHELQDFGRRGLVEFLCCLDAQQAAHIHRSADDRITRLYISGKAFAGQRAGIQRGSSLYDDTVDRNFLTRLDHDDTADFNFVGIHPLHFAVLFEVGVIRTDIHQLADAASALADGDTLKQLPDLVEQHARHAFTVFAQDHRADGRHRHQKALVKNLMVQDSFPGLSQDVISHGKVRYQKEQEPQYRIVVQRKEMQYHKHNCCRNDAQQQVLLFFIQIFSKFLHGFLHVEALCARMRLSPSCLPYLTGRSHTHPQPSCSS